MFLRNKQNQAQPSEGGNRPAHSWRGQRLELWDNERTSPFWLLLLRVSEAALHCSPLGLLYLSGSMDSFRPSPDSNKPSRLGGRYQEQPSVAASQCPSSQS